MIFSNLILLILVLLSTSEIKNNTSLKIVIKQAITEAIYIITYLFIYIKNNNLTPLYTNFYLITSLQNMCFSMLHIFRSNNVLNT